MTDRPPNELQHDWDAIPAKHRKRQPPAAPANDDDDREPAA